MRMQRRLKFGLVVVIVLFLLCACLQAAPVRTIPIPQREHGYQQFDSQVIQSQAALDDFVEGIAARPGRMWNNRDAFIAALTAVALDFSKECLVIVRHTEGSGSVKLSVIDAVITGDRLVIGINRQAPMIRTADMAYYSFAFIVAKSAVNTVEIKVDDKPAQLLAITAVSHQLQQSLVRDRLVTVESKYDVGTTADRLESILQQKGMTLFNRINHTAAAYDVGITLRPTELIIFGNPRIGGQLMQCKQTVAIDLPQKILIWADDQSRVWVTYNDPRVIAQRHQLKGCDAILTRVDQALAAIVRDVVR